MTWQSWQDFAAMGGYGLYVWGSLGVVLGTLALEQVLLMQRRRAALRAIQGLNEIAWRDTAAGSPEGNT
ncbi:MAG TPA: heme exporter protein CcmD [Candidatus Aquabacterium excrementipullorum]|nr:heme exporter protein CcmD [Candidatus Aquabacterium excrementipullorum]